MHWVTACPVAHPVCCCNMISFSGSVTVYYDVLGSLLTHIPSLTSPYIHFVCVCVCARAHVCTCMHAHTCVCGCVCVHMRVCGVSEEYNVTMVELLFLKFQFMQFC